MRISDWSSDVCPSDLLGKFANTEENPAEVQSDTPVPVLGGSRRNIGMRIIRDHGTAAGRHHQHAGRPIRLDAIECGIHSPCFFDIALATVLALYRQTTHDFPGQPHTLDTSH